MITGVGVLKCGGRAVEVGGCEYAARLASLPPVRVTAAPG
jgi:hypothetical protein